MVEVFEILALMMHHKVKIELLSNNPFCVNNLFYVRQTQKSVINKGGTLTINV